MASSHESLQGGDQSETLVAALTLIFEAPAAAQAEHTVRELLKSRDVISLISSPLPWNELTIIEVSLAVNAEGLLILANADGCTRLGQQVEDFAVALKLGTGALYVDQDERDAQTEELIEDPRLDAMPAGRTLVVGALNEQDMLLWAAGSKTGWQFSPAQAESDHALAIHEGFLVGGAPGTTQYPVIMLSRSSLRYTASFWFAKQSSKHAGHPAWVHVWPVASSPAFASAEGSEAHKQQQTLKEYHSTPGLELMDELSEVGIPAEQIAILKRVLFGTGNQQAVRQVLEGFGYQGALADYLDNTALPEDAQFIEPVGMGKAMGRAMMAEARQSSERLRWYNPLSWKPALQFGWGIIEALIFTLMLLGTEWDRPWITPWLIVVLLAVGYLDALGNMAFGLIRLVRKRKQR